MAIRLSEARKSRIMRRREFWDKAAMDYRLHEAVLDPAHTIFLGLERFTPVDPTIYKDQKEGWGPVVGKERQRLTNV